MGFLWQKKRTILSSNFLKMFSSGRIILLCHPTSVLRGTGGQGDRVENKARICILLELYVNIFI